MASPVADHYGCASGGVIRAGRYNVSQFWRDLPAGWSEVSVAGTKPPNGIVAYSGMALDASGGKVYLFGGGHNDYYGNDVWALDLESRSAWGQHYTPSLYSEPTVPDVEAVIDNTNYPGAIMSGGVPVRPISRHTYKSVHWADDLGLLVAGGSSTYSASGEYLWAVYENNPLDWWTYNPISEVWTYKGSTLLNAGYDRTTNIICYHPTRGRAFAAGRDASYHIIMREWSPGANTWTLKSGYASGGSWGSAASIVIDTLRDRLLVINKHSSTYAEVWAYDMDANTWTLLSSTGSVPSGFSESHECVYSAKNDKIYMVASSGFGMYTYDVATGVWSGASMPVSNFAHVLGCFKYDPLRECALLVINQTGNGIRMFAYKD